MVKAKPLEINSRVIRKSIMVSIINNWRKRGFLSGCLLLLCWASALWAGWNRGDVIRESERTEHTSRCQEIHEPHCSRANEWALTSGAVTQDAYDWLRENGWYVTQSAPGVPSVLCACGCFHPDTLILIEDPSGEHKELVAEKTTINHRLVRLDPRSTLSAAKLESAPIRQIIKGYEKQPLKVFELENGRTLKVTTHHGMLLDDGRMVAATDVKSGDRFISTNGRSVTVMGIESELLVNDRVVNFRLFGETHEHHILVAEDVFVGDASFQNEYASDLASIKLRK